MKRNFNYSSSWFKNFRNLFTLRGLAILVATLALSFSVRCLVILFFNLDLSLGDDLFFIGFLISILGYIHDILNELFSPFLRTFIQCEGTGKGKAKMEDNQTYLRPVAYNPNANIRTSRGNFRVSYSDKIEYGRKLEPVSCDKTPESLSSVYFTRPTSDYNKGDDVIRFVPKSSRANVTTPTSPLIRPRISTAQAGPSPPRPSNLSTPRSMSPLFPSTRHESVNTDYSTRVINPAPSPTPVASSISRATQNIVDSTNVSSVKMVNRIDRVSGAPTEVSVKNGAITRKSLSSNITTNTDKEFNIRRNKIVQEVNNQLIGYSSKEVLIEKLGFFGKIKLGFGSIESKLANIYIKYQGLGRRKLL